jgi:hypothetical protein
MLNRAVTARSTIELPPNPMKPPVRCRKPVKTPIKWVCRGCHDIVVGMPLKRLLGLLQSKHGSGSGLAPGLLFILLGRG